MSVAAAGPQWPQWPQWPQYGYSVIAGTVCLFHAFNRLLALQCLCGGLAGAHRTAVSTWKWTNLCCSLTHALLSGTSATIAVYCYPEVLQDLIEYNNTVLYTIAAFSTGYFIYDFLDIVANGRAYSNWEVTLHHVPVCISMLYNIHYQTLIGYHVVIVTLEVNSVFLHARRLLHFYGMPHTAAIYRINAALNFATFGTFRFVPLALCCHGLWWDGHKVSGVYYRLMFTTLSTVVVINFILLWRLVKSDILGHRTSYISHDDGADVRNMAVTTAAASATAAAQHTSQLWDKYVDHTTQHLQHQKVDYTTQGSQNVDYTTQSGQNLDYTTPGGQNVDYTTQRGRNVDDTKQQNVDSLTQGKQNMDSISQENGSLDTLRERKQNAYNRQRLKCGQCES